MLCKYGIIDLNTKKGTNYASNAADSVYNFGSTHIQNYSFLTLKYLGNSCLNWVRTNSHSSVLLYDLSGKP